MAEVQDQRNGDGELSETNLPVSDAIIVFHTLSFSGKLAIEMRGFPVFYYGRIIIICIPYQPI